MPIILASWFQTSWVILRLQKKHFLSKEACPMLHNRILIIIVFILGSAAQGFTQGLGAEMHVARGFLLPHRQNMRHLPEGPAHYGEARLFFQTGSSKPWQRAYNNPQIGLSIRYFDLSNPQILGYGLGMAAYFSSPVLSNDRWGWHLEMGAGPGFISKPFDETNNYRNNAIGSHGNVFVTLGQRFTYSPTSRLDLAMALSFNHFSNAAVALPNLGVNYPMASLGVSYRPEHKNEFKLEENTVQNKIQSAWVIQSAIGFKQAIRPYGGRFGTFSVCGGRMIGLSEKSSITLGGDIFYNNALYHYRKALGEQIQPADNFQSGLHIAYGLHIADATVSITMGAYLIDQYKNDGLFYHRAAFRYFFTEHLGMNLSLKTHLFRADFFELGMAYKF